jgi:hypothetical protein
MRWQNLSTGKITQINKSQVMEPIKMQRKIGQEVYPDETNIIFLK